MENNYVFLKLTNGFELLTPEELNNRYEIFKSKIGFKISMTKLMINEIKKDELLKVLSNKDNNELYKEYLTEIDKIMPKSMQETCFYIKVEDINEPNLKEIASTLFSVSNVTSNELSYVKELFNDVTNAFNYLRSKMFLVPLEWWDL
ncbi:hypothetical protein CF067_16755 [Clostridium sporogenes]|uniref:Uncharacterized protein n=1 Tax=Clostridium botulinum B str. Osaka05 TaxID=1407017 RepID=A0A060N962_CLOBO|nr:hypothetical protein [Clostridium botulinum]BAO05168.1 uncharacterized protein CBO05P2_143 [Clostridium botulinum B str. Osaka05]